MVATASSKGRRTTPDRHCARSASLRGPQLRSTVHLVNSPSVTKLMHKVLPASRATEAVMFYERQLPATSTNR